jgi:hypothetical protein
MPGGVTEGPLGAAGWSQQPDGSEGPHGPDRHHRSDRRRRADGTHRPDRLSACQLHRRPIVPGYRRRSDRDHPGAADGDQLLRDWHWTGRGVLRRPADPAIRSKMTTLTRTGASALYQPQHAGTADRLAFLAAAAGAAIALADCWANRGSPPVAGYFVLMDRQATAAEAARVEALLFRDPAGPNLPTQPKANGLVGLGLGRGDGTEPIVVAELDPTDAPIVSADTIISDVPRSLGFGKAAPITGTAAKGGDWLCLTVLSPPVAARGLQPASAPCHGPAIGIDLSLANAGQLNFRGLGDGFGEPDNGGTAKDPVDVLLDPVSPFNSTKTYTGLKYALVEDSTGIHLVAG